MRRRPRPQATRDSLTGEYPDDRSRFCALAAGRGAGACRRPTTASAEVHPGAQTFTEGAQCTSNFVFRDGASTYLGQAAHCSGTGAATETNGCDAESLPLGTRVEIDGASQPGTLAYNSWIAMQQAGETNADACAYNDFALIRFGRRRANVDSDRSRLRRPRGAWPVHARCWATRSTPTATRRCASGVAKLSPKQGVVSCRARAAAGAAPCTPLTPGVPGDSGSGFLSESGAGDRHALTLRPAGRRRPTASPTCARSSTTGTLGTAVRRPAGPRHRSPSTRDLVQAIADA